MEQESHYIPGSLLAEFMAAEELAPPRPAAPPLVDDVPASPAREERRRTYRLPAVAPRREGKLHLGKRVLTLEILDESSGGFSAVSNEALDCQVGETLLLKIADDWVEVRVMNLRPEGTATRLGLARLRDVDPGEFEPRPSVRPSLENLKRLVKALSPLGRPMAGAAALVLGGIVVSFFIIGAIEQTAPLVAVVHDKDKGKTNAQFEDLGSPKVGSSGPAPKSDPELPANREPKPPEKEQSSPPLIEPQAPATPAPDTPATGLAKVPLAVVRRSQPELLLKPQVAKLLALTREQLAELQRLLEQSRDAASEVLSGAASQMTSGERQLALGRLVLAVLTERQRADLTRVLADNDSFQEPPADEPVPTVDAR